MGVAPAALAAASLALACGAQGPTQPSAVSAGCVPTEATANGVLPLFDRPFDGVAPLGNVFDHDLPLPDAPNGYVLTLCGVRDPTQDDGHEGYDFRMADGTPLRAVADGTVVFAGLEQPHFCAPLNRTVQALVVELLHTAASGERFASVYGHLSRIGVAEGDRLSSGAILGLSGNTGCSGRPHLHFGAAREVAGEFRLIDPYGWHGAGTDPWEADPRGAPSVWLWKPGQAPPLQ